MKQRFDQRIRKFLTAYLALMLVNIYHMLGAKSHLALEFNHKGQIFTAWILPKDGGETPLDVIERLDAEIAALKQQLTEGANNQ